MLYFRHASRTWRVGYTRDIRLSESMYLQENQHFTTGIVLTQKHFLARLEKARTLAAAKGVQWASTEVSGNHVTCPIGADAGANLTCRSNN